MLADIQRPSYLLPPKCDCPCATADPKCDCYRCEIKLDRDRCSSPIKAKFTCTCCKRNVPRCFRAQGTQLLYICKDCELA